jgi:hypothetical protein
VIISRRKYLLPVTAILLVLLAVAALRCVRFSSTTYRFTISGRSHAPITGQYITDGVVHQIEGTLPLTVTFSTREKFSIYFQKNDQTGELTLEWIKPSGSSTYTTGSVHSSISLGMIHSWFKPSEAAWLSMGYTNR